MASVYDKRKIQISVAIQTSVNNEIFCHFSALLVVGNHCASVCQNTHRESKTTLRTYTFANDWMVPSSYEVVQGSGHLLPFPLMKKYLILSIGIKIIQISFWKMIFKVQRNSWKLITMLRIM